MMQMHYFAQENSDWLEGEAYRHSRCLSCTVPPLAPNPCTQCPRNSSRGTHTMFYSSPCSGAIPLLLVVLLRCL